MSYAKTYGSAFFGIDASIIEAEVNISKGIKYHLVGLPDNAVKEGYERMEAALINNGYRMPKIKIVVNLAPADIRKEGSSYDLTIACGILAASGQIETNLLSNFFNHGRIGIGWFN